MNNKTVNIALTTQLTMAQILILFTKCDIK